MTMENKKILVIGSGPIIIGQAAEFDYAGTQACRSLREEGYEVVLVNSNPATIMTDRDIADRVYIEPISLEFVTEVIRKERPYGLLATLGGQVGLNMAVELSEAGILEKYGTALALNEWYGFWGLIILVSWQQIGYMMIIYIAGLQSIPGDVMEAAQIDGAGKWTKLFKVTIPMMMPSITICMFLSLTNGFKLFDQNLSLTAGEPSKMSEMMALNIFNTFYGRTGWEGVGQAKAVLFFVLVVAISMIQLHMTRSKEVQQ